MGGAVSVCVFHLPHMAYHEVGACARIPLGPAGCRLCYSTLCCFGENAAAKAAAHRITFFNRWRNIVCLRLEGCTAYGLPRFFLVVCRFCTWPTAGDKYFANYGNQVLLRGGHPDGHGFD